MQCTQLVWGKFNPGPPSYGTQIRHAQRNIICISWKIEFSRRDGSPSLPSAPSCCATCQLITSQAHRFFHPHAPSPPLNPDAVLFSLASVASGEDLPNWLLLNPSSSEGRLPTVGRFSGASPVTSFADVVKSKGKAPLDVEGPSNPMPKAGPSRRPVLRVGSVSDGFMVGTCHASQPRASSPHPAKEKWQLVIHRRRWHRLASQAPPSAPHRLVPVDPVGRCFNYL
jgi:hypothetical protein